jgi:hypothetical protein
VQTYIKNKNVEELKKHDGGQFGLKKQKCEDIFSTP